MTVGELIAKLGKLDQDMPVGIYDEEWGSVFTGSSDAFEPSVVDLVKLRFCREWTPKSGCGSGDLLSVNASTQMVVINPAED